jgi:hypothetical protein
MRTCALILYINDESQMSKDGVWWDNYGIVKNLQQVLIDNNSYNNKIDISPNQNLTAYVLVKDPNATKFQKMTEAEKTYFSGFSFPFLAFYDISESRTYGILDVRDATKYNAVKSALDVIANTKEFVDGKGYKVQLGAETYFMQDARNAHLPQAENGNIDPKHSLLDLVFIGGGIGFFDRPYLRDFFTNLIDGFKKYWWLIPITIGAVVVYKRSNEKRKNTRYIKTIRGLKKRTPSVKDVSKKKYKKVGI